MDADSLRGSPAGSLVRIRGNDPRFGDYDHFAFVPQPLPPRLELATRTWNAVARATGSLGRLEQACCQLPNPRLLIAPALAKEAVSTSALEGTYGTLPDVLEARLPHFQPRSPAVTEIYAYEQMAELAFRWVGDRPITVGLLCDLQLTLAKASQKPTRDPGQVRTHQVIIGPEDGSVYDARFIPPPPGDHLQAGLDAWQRWVNSDDDLPPIVRAALAHYQFETLHPFGDGNGRVGRLVILLQLLRDGALPEPALTISPWLLKRRIQYQDHLLAVSRTGDWNPWVEFLSTAVHEQCDAHVRVAQELFEWITKVRHQLNDRRWGGVIVRLADDLINWPIITSRFAKDKYGISGPTAKSAIDRLLEIGVIEEITGKNYGRVYAAQDVIRLVESL